MRRCIRIRMSIHVHTHTHTNTHTHTRTRIHAHAHAFTHTHSQAQAKIQSDYVYEGLHLCAYMPCVYTRKTSHTCMYVIYKKYAHIYETFIHVVLEDMNPELIRRTAYVYICHIRRTLYMCIFDMYVIYIKYAHTYETLVYVIVGDANPVLVCRTSYMCTYVIHIESFIYGGSFSTGPFRFCRWVYLGLYTLLFLPAGKDEKCTCRHEITCRDFFVAGGKRYMGIYEAQSTGYNRL